MLDRIRLCMLLVGALTMGLGCDIETTPTGDASGSDVGVDDAGGDALGDADLPLVQRRVQTEAYGIGASWYNYNSATHAVTPRDQVYRFGPDGQATAVRITDYYNDRGTSGHIRLKIRRQSDGTWESVETIGHIGNIKEAPVCVDLQAGRTVDCGDDTADVLFRTDLRVVPAAGFAVQNPALYSTAHFSDDPEWVLGVGSGSSLDPVPDAWNGVGDARLNPEHGLLRPYLDTSEGSLETPVMIQATAAFELALWRAEQLDTSTGEVRLTAWCTELKNASEKQEWARPREPHSRIIEWPSKGGILVDLCASGGPTVVHEYSEPLRGRWPDSDTFGLVLERFDGMAAARIAPGHLIRGTESETFDGSLWVPPGLWE
jgi:hypothetical protein